MKFKYVFDSCQQKQHQSHQPKEEKLKKKKILNANSVQCSWLGCVGLRYDNDLTNMLCLGNQLLIRCFRMALICLHVYWHFTLCGQFFNSQIKYQRFNTIQVYISFARDIFQLADVFHFYISKNDKIKFIIFFSVFCVIRITTTKCLNSQHLKMSTGENGWTKRECYLFTINRQFWFFFSNKRN